MLRSIRLAAALTVLFAAPAYSQEGGLLSINTGLMVWTVAIFLIVLAVLYWKAFPAILGAVEAREEKIRSLLDAAAEDRAAAEALLAEQKKELEQVRTRAQELMAEGREGGERMREEMLEEGRREREAMLDRARRDLQSEVDKAVEQIRGETVGLAIAAASRLVERNLDDEANRALVRDFLERADTRGAAPAGAGV
jgi:F-type H+-transporting ATPase subunit b